MEVLSLQIFVSLVLVLASILLFAFAAKGRDQEHAERLALLPLGTDETESSIDSTAVKKDRKDPS